MCEFEEGVDHNGRERLPAADHPVSPPGQRLPWFSLSAPDEALDTHHPKESVIPDLDGFKTQVRELHPYLADFLVDRIARDQVGRYRRLVHNKILHEQALRHDACSSGQLCSPVAVIADILQPRATKKRLTVQSCPT